MDEPKIKLTGKKYRTVAAMVNDLSGHKSEFARRFRAALKKKRRHGVVVNLNNLERS